MVQALINAKVLTEEGIRDRCCVVVEGGIISDICEQPPVGAEEVDLAGRLLLPGFIDVQVNGGGGRLFNDDPSLETIKVIAAAHYQFGTTGLLPTLISDDFSVIERAIAAVDEAIDAGVPGILGIHIEGPFLSRTRRGIHLESMLKTFEDRFVEALCSAGKARTLVTVAPECIPAAQIARLVEAGAIVSAGHSDAKYETVRAALDAGMTGFTHLFNAMSQLANRAPGMVGAALEDAKSYAGIILDGHHIHPASFRIALKAKGVDHLMLVTDAMPTVGSSTHEFFLQGRKIHANNGRLVSEDGVLAGSTLTMASAVANAIELGRLSLEEAVRMATSTPARFLGMDREVGRIAVGFRADLVATDEDFRINQTWIGGERQLG